MHSDGLQNEPLRSLERELNGIGLFGVLALLMASVVFAQHSTWLVAGRWLLLAALVWGYVYRCAHLRLALNCVQAATALYSNLGWANRLTLLRGGLIAATAGFIVVDERWALWPAIFYTIAAALDRIDGFVARRTERESLLGSELDTAFDALGLLVAPSLAVLLNKLHLSFLLVSVAYYIFIWALRRRGRLGLPCYELMPNFLRRSLAGFQMGFVALALWPIFPAAITQLVGVAFTLPILVGFVVDWLVVSGRINSQLAQTQRQFKQIEQFSFTVLQPLMRFGLIMTLGVLYTTIQVSTVSLYLALSGLLAVVFGCLGRLGALLLLVIVALEATAYSASFALQCAVFLSSWILLLGTGRFSVWQWDDHWVQRYDGAAQSATHASANHKDAR